MIQKRKTAAAARKNKKKIPKKNPYTMKIHESIERIANGKLSDMGLFELSIHALMPCDVYHELQRRIKLIQKHLNKYLNTTSVKVLKSSQAAALEVVNSLLKSSQETRR
jgi:hypothetical protein